MTMNRSWCLVFSSLFFISLVFQTSFAQEDSDQKQSRPDETNGSTHRVLQDDLESFVDEQWANSVPLLHASPSSVQFDLDNSDPDASDLQELVDGKLSSDSGIELNDGQQTVLTVPGNGNARVDSTAVLLWNKRGASGTLTVTAITKSGAERTLASIDQKNHPNKALHIFASDSKTIDRVRLESTGEGARWIGELFLFEADRGQSVFSKGGVNLASRQEGGCVFFSSKNSGNMLNLIDGDRSSQGNFHPSTGEKGMAIFAFRANEPARVRRVELVPERSDGKTDLEHLPKTVEVLMSGDQPFEHYQKVNTYDVKKEKGVKSFRLDNQPEARFVKLRFTPREGERIQIGEVRIKEGTGETYSSLLIRERNEVWRWNRPTSAEAGSFNNLEGIEEQEDNNSTDSAQSLDTSSWVKGELTSMSDRDLFRIELEHDPDRQVPKLDLRMVPFLRGRIRLLNASGDVVRSIDHAEISRRDGTLYLSVKPGTYFLEFTNTPVYMMSGFDTSGSMSGTFSTSRSAIKSWAEDLPDGFHIALANSNCDNGPCYQIVQDFTSSPQQLKQAASKSNKGNKLFKSGTSNWYTVVTQLMNYSHKNVPKNSLGAFTYVADGNGLGSFRDMWKVLRSSDMRVYTIGFGNVGKDVDNETSWDGARGLFNVAWYRGGIYFEPHTTDQLIQTYRSIFDDLTAKPKYAAKVRVKDRGPGKITSTAPLGEKRPYYFILDASGSMRMKLGDRTRIDIAKDVVTQVIGSMPEDWNVGLRVYGHRHSTINPEKAKTDSELVLPVKQVDVDAFRKTIDDLRPLGGTPLAYSLQQAANDVSGLKNPNVIVLTDGEEGFRGDPGKAAATLAGAADGLELNVVGFAIGDQAGRQNLKNMTKAGNGTYYSAEDAEGLLTALKNSIRPKVRYTVETPWGETVEKGALGDTHTLKEGTYILKFQNAQKKIQVRPDRTTRFDGPGETP